MIYSLLLKIGFINDKYYEDFNKDKINFVSKVPMDTLASDITKVMTCLLSEVKPLIQNSPTKSKQDIYEEIINLRPDMKTNPFFYALYSNFYDKKFKSK